MELIDKLPDGVGSDEILDHVKTRIRIEASRKNIRETGGIPAEEVTRRMSAHRKAFAGKNE